MKKATKPALLEAPDTPKVRVEAMVAIMRARAAKVAALDEELAAAKEEYRRIEQESLPDLLRELGLSDLTLLDGTKVVIEEIANTSITEAKRELAHAWLRQHGFGGLIDCVVAAKFAVGEEKLAAKVAEAMAKRADRPVDVAERVHPSRLLSFVKEQLEKGAPIPFDLFGIHPFSRAKLKAPSAKKTKG